MKIVLKGDGVHAAHCNQYRHVPGCRHAGEVPRYKAESSGAEARRLATESLRAVVGKKLRNLSFGIEATISGNSLKKIVSGNALGTSFRSLVDTGFCDKDTAFRIHMVAVANLPELFAKAPNKEEQEVYHERANRKTATHLYSPFNVEGRDRPFIADISVIGYKGVGDKRVYSIGVKVWPPLPTSGASQVKLRGQSEGGDHRSHADIKARIYSDVKPKGELKEQSRGCRDQGSGLDTGNPSGADPRDIFRIAKKAYSVKPKNRPGSDGAHPSQENFFISRKRDKQRDCEDEVFSIPPS